MTDGTIDCILTSLCRDMVCVTISDLSMVREGRRVEVDAERKERKEIKSYKFGIEVRLGLKKHPTTQSK